MSKAEILRSSIVEQPDVNACDYVVVYIASTGYGWLQSTTNLNETDARMCYMLKYTIKLFSFLINRFNSEPFLPSCFFPDGVFIPNVQRKHTKLYVLEHFRPLK